MPSLAFTRKNSTSGPRSRASLSSGLSWAFSVMDNVYRAGLSLSFHPGNRPGEIARGERRQILDALANADEMHGQAKPCGERHQDAAARGAVELGHHQPGDARDLLEDLHLRQRVLPDGGVEHEQHGMGCRGI